MNLTEFLSKYPNLRKYYQTLERFLPSPDEILVGDFTDLEKEGFVARETVLACAMKPNKLFFRHFPPNKYVFTHELIHLCRKYDEHEEVYAYNLLDAVVYLAEKGLHNVDVFKLFNLSIEEIEAVLKRFGFETIEDFYEVMGIIPLTHKLSPTGIVREEHVTDKHVVVVFVTELIAGLEYFEIYKRIFEKLVLNCDYH